MKDIICAKRYRVNRKIAEGGFGLVYEGTDMQSGEDVALKLTYYDESAGPMLLERENDIYQELSGGVGISQTHLFTYEDDFCILVLDLLGPSLEDLFNYCGRRFSLKTILLIADQAISRIKYIHSKGVLHRDIKPENFVMGVGKQGNTLYAIDFGIAQYFEEAQNRKNATGLQLVGTRRYASIRAHNGRQQSWADDLESLGYIFVEFARGSLPWQGIKAATEDERRARVGEMKESLSGEALCDGFLPKEFATYINYTRSLGFDDKPNYSYLRWIFSRLFRAKGFQYDHVFGWTEKLFYEQLRGEGEDHVDS
ncbi:kinase-like domain-containing protein [Pseudoneurospora amorphoporcata]|uniref:non-specific serine/threonine protein kinase n=1 Tax=Pseudoneurospora amorphoporcata TaxID=241081 RepID=A0AAN6NL20_9PEZI|nr:kinase-like domain-containing protein [Pseudoneurospora amorphoporcata]